MSCGVCGRMWTLWDGISVETLNEDQYSGTEEATAVRRLGTRSGSGRAGGGGGVRGLRLLLLVLILGANSGGRGFLRCSSHVFVFFFFVVNVEGEWRDEGYKAGIGDESGGDEGEAGDHKGSMGTRLGGRPTPRLPIFLIGRARTLFGCYYLVAAGPAIAVRRSRITRDLSS